MSQSLQPPPAGSVFRFEITPEGRNRVSWSTGGRWYVRLFPAIFLAVWLCGWAVGEIAVGGILIGMLIGKAPFGLGGGGGPEWFVVAFLLVWFTFWTIGGVSAMMALHFLLKRPRDEAVTLGDEELLYDPGSSVVGSLQNVPRKHGSFRKWLNSRKPRTIERSSIDKVSLRWVPGRQQLTLDLGVERLEIGPSLTEVEREWLANALANWAGLPLAGNAVAVANDET